VCKNRKRAPFMEYFREDGFMRFSRLIWLILGASALLAQPAESPSRRVFRGDPPTIALESGTRARRCGRGAVTWPRPRRPQQVSRT